MQCGGQCSQPVGSSDMRSETSDGASSDSLAALRVELERFGKANDSAANTRTARMLNITRETGELLSVLVRATVARRILEIGTSNG